MNKKDFFKEKFREWRRELKDHWKLILLSLFLFSISIVAFYLAGFYVTYKATVATVPDLILKYFGPYDLNFLYAWGFLLIATVYIAYPLFFKVKLLHVALAQSSLLLLVRSIFIILTHLQTPAEAIPAHLPGILSNFKFMNDMFFSGHVAFSFLGFLVFKDNKIKYFFLISSIIMAITVLAMHQHYSIDVFAAFFITYTCCKVGDYAIMKLRF